MKKILKTALVLVLALVLAVQTPLQALAAEAEGPDYISEVKVFMGGSAEKDLAAEGYTAVKDADGKVVDLNQGAGGGWGSQGDKKVIMGYKTTKLQSEAITDLAVMNMEGGYDVQEYDALMKQYMGGQISPFIDSFLVAINEYRENLGSDDDVNRQRAEYIRAALNKFTDDDCAGAGLGDLLVNETVYEMAKPQFDQLPDKDKEEIGISGMNAQVRDALPEAEKNQHCDILTLFAQADGQLMLMIYDLITRGADTNEDSWMERFSSTSYEDLLDSYDMPEEDAKQQMARDFEDDAKLLLANWDKFRTLLIGADDDAETLNGMDAPDYAAVEAKVEALNDGSSAEEYVDALAEVVAAQAKQMDFIECAANVTVADYLESIDYGDGTMYDFFTRSGSDVAANIESLFPLVASLSDGQRAGTEFISLRELVMLSNRDVEYRDSTLDDMVTTSVYDGVDRGIYEKGGVALTWDAKRKEALEAEKNREKGFFSRLSAKTYVMYALTGASVIGFIGSVSKWGITRSRILANKQALKTVEENILRDKTTEDAMSIMNKYRVNQGAQEIAFDANQKTTDELEKETLNTTAGNLAATSKTAAWMSAGFAVAMVILAGVSIYLTWKDMKDYYKVDYAVIPHYMVDETSITYYNANGEKLVKENHAAYYKAVTCNRSENDKNHEALTDCADLNGDVGQQWVALYACRDNKVMPPILADSFKAVAGSTDVPASYTKGIHMFGSDSAFNMNNKLYVWNQNARSVFVYYKVDTTAPLTPRTSGSAFSGGMLALTGVGGLALGALITALSMTAYRKKKNGMAAA